MSKYFEIGSKRLNISLIEDIISKNRKIRLSKNSIIKIKKSRNPKFRPEVKRTRSLHLVKVLRVGPGNKYDAKQNNGRRLF